MAEKKMTMSELRKLVRREITEAVDYEGAKTVVTVAGKMLGALESFESDAPRAAKNAMQNRCGELKDVLEDMVSNPGSYVDKVKPENDQVAVKDESPKPLDNAAQVTVKKETPNFVESVNRRIPRLRRS